MSQENTQPEQISDDHSKAIDHVLKQIDITTVSAHDVFADIINRAKRFNFELMVACSLMEKVLIKEKTESIEQGNEDEGQRVES
jgi:hypothetical protein